MEVEIGEVISTVRAIDSDSMLAPHTLDTIARAVGKVINDEREHQRRWDDERSITSAVSHEQLSDEAQFMQQIQKAFLVATFKNDNVVIPVQFNPTEFTLEKGAQLADINIPGLDAPLIQFVHGQSEKLTMDLFFDTTEDGMSIGATSVTTLTDAVYGLVKIDPHTHAPPIVTFHWNREFPGTNIPNQLGNQARTSFQCVIENVKQKFTLFSPEGVPLRATLSVTFREYKTLEQQLAQLNLQSPDRTHSHAIQGPETLSAIAAEHYADPTMWRQIADANAIRDPRRITPGTLIRVPALTN